MIKHFLIFLTLTLILTACDKNHLQVEAKIVTQTNKNQTEEKNHPIKPLKVVDKTIHNPSDIKIFTQKSIKPINYTNTISLNTLEVSEKKQKFFHMILPAILISKQKLKNKRDRVLSLMSIPPEELSHKDSQFLETLYETYQTTDNNQLLNRMKTHPVSIVLAQAAIESAWGESRFFKKGNNIFGMWSYNTNESRIKAQGNRNGKSVYVKKYHALSDAIDDYFVVIGRGAYENFREQRTRTNDPLKLVQYLTNYCELREKYTNKLKKFIVNNNLKQYDKFKIDKKYI
jgi:Bax protein